MSSEQSNCFTLFHLNLGFSSIPKDRRADVVASCYWPMLKIIESEGFHWGVEINAWSLEQIQALDPKWVETFKKVLDEKKCELVGSGYSQMIGPLVPYDLNLWNQERGLEIYQKLLNTRPSLALVNEMAYSDSLVSLYARFGYQGFIMDQANVLSAMYYKGINHLPVWALGPDGAKLPVLWTNSTFFQKFQRYIHGDISLSDYLSFFARNTPRMQIPVPIYCNDAEIFDFRPGRFHTEAELTKRNEWVRIKELMATLREKYRCQFQLPSVALQNHLASVRDNGLATQLTSAKYPVPVKKQQKYNIARWAVSGRDDITLNSICHRIYPHVTSQAAQAKLCHWWASDFRTHIGNERWQELQKEMSTFCDSHGISTKGFRLPSELFAAPINQLTDPALSKLKSKHQFEMTTDEDALYLQIKSPHMRMRLNMRRGLTMDSLAFKSHGFSPIVGTVHQGYFDDIDFAADFFSGGLLIEIPGAQRRITDLDWLRPSFEVTDTHLLVSGILKTDLGEIKKYLKISFASEELEMGFAFSGWKRPMGICRVARMTFLPVAKTTPKHFSCRNGGADKEQFEIRGDFDHKSAVSSLASCGCGVGATDGRLQVNIGDKALHFKWDPAETAAFPMLSHRIVDEESLLRLSFSLVEMDDTLKEAGELCDFRVKITPKEL